MFPSVALLMVLAARVPLTAPARADGVVTDAAAIEKAMAALEAAVTNRVAAAPDPNEAETAFDFNMTMGAVAIVLGMFVFRVGFPKYGEKLLDLFNPWASKEAEADSAAEAKAFSEFAEKLAVGPSTTEQEKSRKVERSEGPRPQAAVLAEFLRSVPKEVAAMRSALAGISGSDPTKRQLLLNQAAGALGLLKSKSANPSVRPLWLMAAALEGLLLQLAKKPAEINSSALRTIASALDLLNALSRPGIKADLASAPPVRVLAVDDDAICRHALSFALQKVLSSPDLASDGQAALALATQSAYDVIFLDVEMPGMDGYEVCSRLRATPTNRDTPVVFVTRHSDFDSRAKSSLSGGQDLIGKPFLTYEIAVKALTMILRRRLQLGSSPGHTVHLTKPKTEVAPAAAAA